MDRADLGGAQRPAALIVSGIDQTPAARRLLEDAGCPIVQIMETGPDPVDMMIGFSHFDGGATVTRHLIEVGYRRIGFVGARMDPRSQRRLAGYRAAMQAAELYDPRLVITTPIPSSVSLGRELSQCPGACVAVGDFNVTPWSSRYRDLLKTPGVRDCAANRGWLPTWNSGLPALLRIRIDQCLTSGALEVADVRVGEAVGSDHFATINGLYLSGAHAPRRKSAPKRRRPNSQERLRSTGL